MKKKFWISDPPIFFYGALKIAIFEFFWQKFVSCSKMWQKFLFHGRLPTYPIIFRFKSWSDRKFLGGATEPFRTTELAFLDPKNRLQNPLANWYFKQFVVSDNI